MERACRAVRFGVRCVGRGASALALGVGTALAALYRARPHSCVLYLASVLLDELAAVAAPALAALLEALLPRAFALLTAAALRDHPDTVDDLFRLCIRSFLLLFSLSNLFLIIIIGSPQFTAGHKPLQKLAHLARFFFLCISSSAYRCPHCWDTGLP
jgi:hypothetical protein